MTAPFYNRRTFLRTATLGTSALAAPMIMSTGFASPAAAQALSPSETMRGGSNNYRPNAPIVDSLGSGFMMTGLVRDAASGDPLGNVRIQIWAATVMGSERDAVNHGSVLTRADGTYSLEMPQIVPNFGQPHAHLAYDDAAYETVFLRPIMPSASDTSLNVDFVLSTA